MIGTKAVIQAPHETSRTILILLAVVALALVAALGASTPGPIWIAMGLLVASAVAVLTGARRQLLAIAFTVVILTSSSLGGAPEALFYARFATYAVLAFATMTLYRTWTASVRERFLLMTLGGLAIVAAASASWSIMPVLSAQRALGLSLLFLVVALTSFGGWHSEAAIRRDLLVLALVVIVVTVANLGLFVISPSWAFSASRFRGLLQNPNSIGVLAALSLPIVVALGSTSRSVRKILWLAGGAAIVLSVLISQSRGGIVASFIGVVVFMVLRRSLNGRRQLAAILALSIAAGCTLVLLPDLRPAPVDAIVERLEGKGKAAGGSGRTAAWELAGEVWSERWFSGWGFGTAEHTFGVRSVEIEQVFKGLHPHNALLEVLLEVGPLGLILLVSALGVVIVGLKMRALSDLHAGLFGSFFAGIVLMFVESGLTSAGSINAFLFWFVVFGTVRLSAHRDTTPRSYRV